MAPLRSNKKAREHSWQLQEAKSRLSKVVEHALQEGPQTITLRGKPAVVIISYDEFQNLIREIGRIPAQRSTTYTILKQFAAAPFVH